MGIVAPLGKGASLGWMVGARASTGGRIGADPSAKWLVPFVVRRSAGLLSFTNAGGARFELNGFENQNEFWRMAARIDRSGRTDGPLDVALDVDCGKVGFYGQALEGLGACTPTRPMAVFGASLLTSAGTQRAPGGVGSVTFMRRGGALVATLRGSRLRTADHVLSVLAVDRRTNRPLPLDYSYGTATTTTGAGVVERVSVPLGRYSRTPLRAYLTVDATAAATANLG